MPADLTPEQAKKVILNALTNGDTVLDACKKAGKSERTYKLYKQQDENFRRACAAVMATRKRQAGDDQPETGDFESFRLKYLHSRSFIHQLQWIDILEGREPRDLHPNMIYEPARPTRLIINTPPNMSKTTSVTIDYPTYRICRDPNVRIIVVSKTQAQAKKFVYGIKQRLTHPNYAELIGTFGPQGGFKASADQWTATHIYLGSESRDSGEKDPTVEALGMGGQIYGARADLIILDDCVTLSNAHEWEKQMDWIRQEVASRLGPGGKLLVIGTRVAPIDLYKELRSPEHYTDGRSPWTYMAQPAVLEFGDAGPEGWVSLWPKSDRPFEGMEDVDLADEDGLYDRWTGPRLAEIRNDVGPGKWAMVYMQQDVSEDAVFPAVCVRGSAQGMRKVGPLQAGLRGHPERGSEGMYLIGSVDPATSGDAGFIMLAADRASKKRFVLDAVRMAHPTPHKIHALMKEWTERYRPAEWRVEKNGANMFLSQDPHLREWLAGRGVTLREHYTGNNKWDAGWGVASMAPLFGRAEPDRFGTLRHVRDSNLIELPDVGVAGSEGVKALVEQLIAWAPDTKNKQDMVMALWFAEIRAREICNQAAEYSQSHLKNRFLTPAGKARQVVVRIDELAQARMERQAM